jgi:hypothetical protein
MRDSRESTGTTTTTSTSMRQYIGTKMIAATPQSRGDYNESRGWPLPAGERADDEGYRVVYPDGYVSWSPRHVFEEAYRAADAMPFGLALEAMRKGERVARRGWNGKAMFLFLVPGSRFKVNRAPLLGIYPEGTEIDYHAHVDMRTATGQVVPWLCSQTDMLADDWFVVETPAT